MKSVKNGNLPPQILKIWHKITISISCSYVPRCSQVYKIHFMKIQFWFSFFWLTLLKNIEYNKMEFHNPGTGNIQEHRNNLKNKLNQLSPKPTTFKIKVEPGTLNKFYFSLMIVHDSNLLRCFIYDRLRFINVFIKSPGAVLARRKG